MVALQPLPGIEKQVCRDVLLDVRKKRALLEADMALKQAGPLCEQGRLVRAGLGKLRQVPADLRVLVDRLLHQSSVCAGQGEYHRFLFFKMALQVALPEIPDVGADTVSGDAKLQTFLYSAANHKAMMMVVRKRR